MPRTSTEDDSAGKEPGTKHEPQRSLLALRAVNVGIARRRPRNWRKRAKKWLTKTWWILIAILLQYAIGAL